MFSSWFQHTAARRRLDSGVSRYGRYRRFNTQPPEGGWIVELAVMAGIDVSTHSRPKAAGKASGCNIVNQEVSTHSRPKAAGTNKVSLYTMYWFQHTAARRRLGDFVVFWLRHGGFQHTAARRRLVYRRRVGRLRIMFQHTAARRRLGYNLFLIFRHFLFQHTAARRRLVHIVLSDLLAF